METDPIHFDTSFIIRYKSSADNYTIEKKIYIFILFKYSVVHAFILWLILAC